MKKKVKVISLTLIIIALIFIVFLKIQFFGGVKDVKVVIDKAEYASGDVLKVKIVNGFWERISFSLCYPYFLERKNGDWEIYDYVDCEKFNGNDYTIGFKRSKMFELTLPEVPDGTHRLRIPICISCKKGENFKADYVFYSNEFQIKNN